MPKPADSMSRWQYNPAHGEDARYVPMGEDEHVASTNPSNDTIARVLTSTSVSPPGQPSSNRRQPGRLAWMSDVRRPSYAP